MIMKFTDIHAHFAYGMDDGAQTRAEIETILEPKRWVSKPQKEKE